jgi:ribosome-binding protein aMBF1 (putative translation factor)
MASEELSAKRSQALHLTRRATHKISRLKNSADVIIAGSQFDYRKPPKLIKRYTEKQLDAYIARQTQFVDRSTQFVPDAQHRPIPAAEFKPLHLAQQKRYELAQAKLNTVGDTLLPGGTETIEERRAKMRADRKLAGNPSVTDPYEPVVNKSTDIANREAIKTLTKEARQKSSKGWDNKELKRQIGEFSQMVNRIGDADLAAAVKKLSKAQFRTLWNDTAFATAVSTQYEIVRTDLISEEDKPWHIQVIHDAFTDARRLVDWAQNLDPETGAGRTRADKPKSKRKR